MTSLTQSEHLQCVHQWVWLTKNKCICWFFLHKKGVIIFEIRHTPQYVVDNGKEEPLSAMLYFHMAGCCRVLEHFEIYMVKTA